MGRGGTTTGKCDIAVRSPQDNGPVMIGGISVPPTMEHSGSLKFSNKQQSTSPRVSRNTQKFDASVNENLANDGDYTSIFSNLLVRELSESPSTDIYSCYQTDFTSNAVSTEAPNFVILGIPDVNASYEFNTFGTPTTRLRRTTYGYHWYTPGYVFGGATSAGIS